jgi:hypothetical protein
VNSEPGSTQILTQRRGAKSKTVSKLGNSGTMSTRHVPLVQPIWVIETPEDGVSAHATTSSNNSDGVGTTAGFQVMTMEALAHGHTSESHGGTRNIT